MFPNLPKFVLLMLFCFSLLASQYMLLYSWSWYHYGHTISLVTMECTPPPFKVCGCYLVLEQMYIFGWCVVK